MSKTIKKRYLKALNRELKKASAGDAATTFVFYPPGAKSKSATGVTCSGPADKRTLAVMNDVQAKVQAAFERAGETV